MTLYAWPILLCWLAYLAYWTITARSAKRDVGKRRWWQQWAVTRIGFVLLVILALQSPALRRWIRGINPHAVNASPAYGIAGVLFCATGVGLAIWARTILGRNWGMPMSQKEDPELVTQGPYSVIRHPIYAGVLLAFLGSALATSLAWLLPLIFCCFYFLLSARQEEKLMLAQFPQSYPAYRARTKMLIPYLF
ncbi:MAG TPA: isoprenylcysteine carboxylmethyltransferase family protein [Rhizomicrobium sp.]|nr:isoprenylcysteine carboxylmethyltransferase family protein [Rhizomicrobium sp.]